MDIQLYVIINIDQLWDDAHRCRRRGGIVLPEDQRPTYLHTDKAKAEEELCRLTAAHGEKFVLFACVASGQEVDVVTGVFEGQEQWARKHLPFWIRKIAKVVPVTSAA